MHLTLCWYLSSHHEKEDALRQWLLSLWSLGQQLLQLWDTVATETNTLWTNKYMYMSINGQSVRNRASGSTWKKNSDVNCMWVD